MEIWKQYKDSNYEVSTLGNIRNKKTGRILKQCNDKAKYKRVSIYVKKKHITKTIHRMVAETFIPNPDNLPEVDHINNIRDDNRVENLQWCTGEYNLEKSYKKGYRTYPLRVGIKISKDGITKKFVSKHECSRYIKEKECLSSSIRSIYTNINWALKRNNKCYGYQVEREEIDGRFKEEI